MQRASQRAGVARAQVSVPSDPLGSPRGGGSFYFPRDHIHLCTEPGLCLQCPKMDPRWWPSKELSTGQMINATADGP